MIVVVFILAFRYLYIFYIYEAPIHKK